MNVLQKINQKFLDIFVVKPSSGVVVPYLDGIRAFAVLFVLIRHAWGVSGSAPILFTMPVAGNVVNLSPLVMLMSNGVDLFFVLSGFLLAQHWLKADYQGQPRPSVRKYFKQRFFRIAPAYYVSLFLFLLFFTPRFIPVESVYSLKGLLLIGIHSLFLQTNFIISWGAFPANSPLWTLTIEVWFYLMVPWVSVLFFKNRWFKTLPVVLALTLLWLYFCKHLTGPIVDILRDTSGRVGINDILVRYFLSEQFPAHMFDFAMGIVIANLVVRYKLNYKPNATFRFFSSPLAGKVYFFAGWFIVLYFMNKLGAFSVNYNYWYGPKVITDPSPDATFYYYLREIPMGLGFGLIIAGLSLGGKWLQRIFSFTPLRFVGITGFSVYLWHMPMIYLFNSLPGIASLQPAERFPALLGSSLVATLLLSSLMYLFVEKPFMLMGRKGQAAGTPARPAVVTALELNLNQEAGPAEIAAKQA